LSGRVAAAVVLTMALLAAGLGTASPASAANRVTGRDFPTVGQVAKHYSYFRGGSRDLLGRGSQVNTATPSCVAFDESSVRVRSSRVVTYLMSGGRMAYFEGNADPWVGVYLFSSRAKAAKALSEVRATTKACWGTHRDGGYRVTHRWLRMPALGTDRFAFRRIVSDWFAETWVLRGRRLVNTVVQDREAPAVKPLFGLTRTAGRVAG
jgi:hypothetical protein